MVTLPISVAISLGLVESVQFDVFVDYEEKEIIYKLVDQSTSLSKSLKRRTLKLGEE